MEKKIKLTREQRRIMLLFNPDKWDAVAFRPQYLQKNAGFAKRLAFRKALSPLVEDELMMCVPIWHMGDEDWDYIIAEGYVPTLEGYAWIRENWPKSRKRPLVPHPYSLRIVGELP